MDAARATYHNSTGDIVITGNITFESLYYLKGENNWNPLYLSKKANNSNTGDWSHVEKITRNANDEKTPKTIKINITNDAFFNFLLSKELSNLKCIGIKDWEVPCNSNKQAWHIADFEFIKEAKVLVLKLEKDFNYAKN